jgi:pyridoxine/pyridoxamine 5'-phosphate oxidase
MSVAYNVQRMATIDRTALVAFLKTRLFGVLSTISPEGEPEAAVVGIAITDQLEIVFDTLSTTRKIRNLRHSPKIAFVIGWDRDEITVQLEGIADEPTGADLDRLKRTYFAAHPSGPKREHWAYMTYVRVKPHWIRYSDFKPNGAIVEFTREQL